ncbi:MAG: hypothetical protein AAF998_19335 [Bacteroidota bacterium]
MSTITGSDYDQDRYRTPITDPPGDIPAGAMTLTLRVPPIGQPNFRVDQATVVITGPDVNRRDGVVTQVFGPSQYGVNLG